jgi:hypothetical protein
MYCTRRTIWCMSLALCALLLTHPVQSQDYSADGPYGSTSTTQPFQLPAATGCGKHCSLTVRLTVPVAPAAVSSAAVRGPPYPLVAFFNGFQVSSHQGRCMDSMLQVPHPPAVCRCCCVCWQLLQQQHHNHHPQQQHCH